MDTQRIEERLAGLEKEIRAVRADLGLAPARRRVLDRLQRLSKFALTNWVLLSFVVALGTAAYVKLAFGVEYFRDYRNIQTVNSLSAFYTQLGDTLMARAEFAAAQDAYRSALQVKPGNIEATLGIVKAQVFDPPKGEEAYSPEVTDAKLNYLLLRYGDDDQVLFLKGLRCEYQGRPQEAKEWYQKALAKNPNSVGSYLELGYLHMGGLTFDVEEAARNLKKGLELDPTFPVAHLNLGYLYLYLFEFESALHHLSESYRLSPTWVAAIGLADMHRYQGNPAQAAQWRQIAFKGVDESKSKTDRFVGGESLMAQMPLRRGDQETIQSNVYVSSNEEKKAFTRYGLALDYAVEGDLAKAGVEFGAARKLDKDGRYTEYFAQAIASVENLCEIDAGARHWLEERRRELSR